MGCPVRYYRSYWLLLMNRVKEEIHMKEYIKNASITNLMGWHIADILLPARIKQLKEKILIIR